MKNTVKGIGIFFVVVALVLLASPDRILSVLDWGTRPSQMLAGAIRVTLGAAFVWAAPATRYPKGIRLFGIAIVVAGLIVVTIPNAHWASLIRWVFEDPTLFRFAGAVGGVLFGGFLIHASSPQGATSIDA